MAKQRITNDFYPTHQALTLGMLHHPLTRESLGGMPAPGYPGRPLSALECCVGDGAIADVLQSRYPVGELVTNDIDPQYPADTHLDASTPALWDHLRATRQRPLSWVISNPPYKLAPQIVPLAYDYAGRGVIMLLRLSFFEPCQNRMDFLLPHPPTAVIIAGNPRPSFRPDGGTDNVTTAWYIWDKHHTPRIGFITNGGRKW